jgi:HEAT repeat protein
LFDSGGPKYVASKFLESNLKVDTHDFNLVEYIIYNQYVMLDYAVKDTSEYVKNLKEILEQYQAVTGRLLE